VNPELREAIRTLVRHAESSDDAEIRNSVRIVTGYVEHGPMPSPADKDYIPFARPAVQWKPKRR
jgi:hypothetical protein